MFITRFTKQIIITLVFLAIFSSIGWFVYSRMKPAPDCFDGKQNQNEQGVDCGGLCQKQCEKVFETQDLVVQEKSFVPGGQGKFDVMMRLKNPNNQVGVSSFSYNFKLKGASGNVLAERSGTNFILPVELKYIIETNLETLETPQTVEVTLSDPKREEFFGYERPELNIYSREYNLISSGVGYSEAKGLLRNESAFDFSAVKINVVLRSSSGVPLAFNKTEMNTINSGEERDFRILWPVNFPGKVENSEMEAEADVFNSQNFILKYTGTKNQQFQKNK